MNKKVVIICCQLCPNKRFRKHPTLNFEPYCAVDETILPYTTTISGLGHEIAVLDGGIKEGCPLEDDV